MTSAHTDALLAVAESQLGYAEQADGTTKFGHWYEATHAKKPGFADAAWCDMFVSWAATQTGQADAVGQFAWTPDHAQWYKDQGAWGSVPQPGAVVFFDWDGSNDIAAIDHVGLVKSVTGPETVTTIEGNISNQVVSKTRDHATIVGYGYPDKVREKNQAKVKLAAASGQGHSGQAGTQALAMTATAPAGPGAADATAVMATAALVPAVLAAALVKRAGLTGRLRALRERLGTTG